MERSGNQTHTRTARQSDTRTDAQTRIHTHSLSLSLSLSYTHTHTHRHRRYLHHAIDLIVHLGQPRHREWGWHADHLLRIAVHVVETARPDRTQPRKDRDISSLYCTRSVGFGCWYCDYTCQHQLSAPLALPSTCPVDFRFPPLLTCRPPATYHLSAVIVHEIVLMSSMRIQVYARTTPCQPRLQTRRRPPSCELTYLDSLSA